MFTKTCRNIYDETKVTATLWHLQPSHEPSDLIYKLGTSSQTCTISQWESQIHFLRGDEHVLFMMRDRGWMAWRMRQMYFLLTEDLSGLQRFCKSHLGLVGYDSFLPTLSVSVPCLFKRSTSIYGSELCWHKAETREGTNGIGPQPQLIYSVGTCT